MVAPINLENDDIKAKDGEELLFEEKTLNVIQHAKRNLLFTGLPTEQQDEAVPLMFLVPHVRSQLGNLSVSMINISNILTSLLVTACIVKEDQQKEYSVEAAKDLEQHLRAIREEERIKQQL